MIIHGIRILFAWFQARRLPRIDEAARLGHPATMLDLALPTLAATEALAARLAGLMRPNDTILLEGALGAGKSALTRALLRALTNDPALEVPSPTYTLMQAYPTPIGLVHHFDLWRLDGPAALHELGWDDAETAIVEWPDRLGSLRPAAALAIALTHTGGDARHARLTGWEDRL